MNDDPVCDKKPRYPSHHWGALANDPSMKIAGAAAEDAFHRAALRAWRADGGSIEAFEALCVPNGARS